jgi:phosphoadenosine phosphosulfate reductase
MENQTPPPIAASAREILHWAIEEFGQRFALVTSFQREGMVILDIAARISPAVRVITLDTGRLPEETYQMMDTVRERYGVRVEVVLPDGREVEAMVAAHGANLFRREPVLRKLCCQVRKVRPLDLRLAGLDAYAVGLRRGQGESRESVEAVNRVDGRYKISPLAEWTAEELEQYRLRHNVPDHPLYARGFASIGCAPCTRAVSAGEGERAGRWWWEQAGDKECGLHISPEGKMERELDVLVREIAGAHA